MEYNVSRVLKVAIAAVGAISPHLKVGGAQMTCPSTSSSAPWVRKRAKRLTRLATSHARTPTKGRCARCAKKVSES